MRQTRILMGMPITVEVVDKAVAPQDLDAVYAYFDYVDHKFSTYKSDSEISKINRKEIDDSGYSPDMKKVLELCEVTKKDTGGYFDIKKDNYLDPSGLVKGWAIKNAASILKDRGLKNFFVEAGGDIEISGKNKEGKNWRVGIRNPSNITEIVKILPVTNLGVATSGTYIRGQHVYNPLTPNSEIHDIVSLTVIAEDIYEADRMATTAFAMGKDGIHFIESLDGFEGYVIDTNQIATMTSGFKKLAN